MPRRHKDYDYELSKALSLFLRHTARELGYQIHSDARVTVEDVLHHLSQQWRCKALHAVHKRLYGDVPIRRFEIFTVIKFSKKDRFQAFGNGREGERKCITHLRAVNGHSPRFGPVDDSEIYTILHLPDSPKDPKLPPHCIHGTTHSHLQRILQEGLRPGGVSGNRTHVYAAPWPHNHPKCVGGMRKESEVSIHIDLRACMVAGMEWMVSANGALQTASSIPPQQQRPLAQ